ncbi:unnamed protein product [Plutella xylostella]|uniref:(diamondback moth) hypothetical protein n=1 Tax=Plutella xylostella TaxID=51655 RepID=A0A8S4GA80_PLUXY|nr:unnamed protein product [Plutella xylostella]
MIVGDATVEVVQEYVYLGETIRLGRSNFDKKTKDFNQCVLPVMTYGAETWALTNKGLELRVAVLEQRSHDTDQKLLSNSLEISGVPAIPEQTPASIADKVASKLNIKSKDIQSARRLPGRQDKTGGILVELRNQIDRDQWILAAKQHEIKVGDLGMQTPIEAADSRIFIREALTINMKTLLFNAKQRMRDSFKYIWCKDGRILVRKTDNSKVQAIRCLADIDSLLK